MAVAVEATFRGERLSNTTTPSSAFGLSPGGPTPRRLVLLGREDGLWRPRHRCWASNEAFDRFLQEQVVPISAEAGLPSPRFPSSRSTTI
jgi:hypothetical protein